MHSLCTHSSNYYNIHSLEFLLRKVIVQLNCRNGEGPTVLIVKDKEDCIYGGYASQPWDRHGDFYGDMKSFLFQLYPKASIFKPTGANSNIQWVCINLCASMVKKDACEWYH